MARKFALLRWRLLEESPAITIAVAISTLLAIAAGDAYARVLDPSRPDRSIAARQHHTRVVRQGCSQRTRMAGHYRHAPCRRLDARVRTPAPAVPYDWPGHYVLHGPHF